MVPRPVFLFFASLQATALLAGSVTVSLGDARNACTVISLPHWKPASLPPSSPSTDWTYVLVALPALSDWDFRQFEDGVLIGLFARAKAFQPEPRYYSPDRYAVSLPSGKVQKEAESQWASAEPYAIVRDSKLPRGPELSPKSPLILDGETYRPRGPKWPEGSGTLDAARVSLDGQFRALNSWDGEEGGGGDLSFPGGGHNEGSYYVDIYDSTSRRLVLALRGHFQGTPVSNLFHKSTWISSRFYLFPLNEEANRFVLCDMERIASAAPGPKR